MSGKTFAFVGTLNRTMPNFARAAGAGICVLQFDEEIGCFSLQSTFEGVDNPSFLAIDAEQLRLYACTEWTGRNEGIAVSLAIAPDTGALTYLNMQPTLGSVTCHLSLDSGGGYLFASNFTVSHLGSLPGAAVAAFRIRSDGGIAPAAASVRHEGPEAQLPVDRRSHPHSAIVSPNKEYLTVPDLGLDRVIIYKLPPTDGRLELAEQPFAELPEGSGPRHMVFSDDGLSAYVINELSNSMAAFAFDAGRGRLTLRQTISTLPEGFVGISYCADLTLSPDGRFLYGTNRGHNSVVRFAIELDGTLTQPAWTPSGGDFPRSMTFDPSGRYLIVANERGDNIVVFRQDPETGELVNNGHEFRTGTPMRVVFGHFPDAGLRRLRPGPPDLEQRR